MIPCKLYRTIFEKIPSRSSKKLYHLYTKFRKCRLRVSCINEKNCGIKFSFTKIRKKKSLENHLKYLGWCLKKSLRGLCTKFRSSRSIRLNVSLWTDRITDEHTKLRLCLVIIYTYIYNKIRWKKEKSKKRWIIHPKDSYCL